MFVAALVANLIEAYVSPRQSARRIISMQPTGWQALEMVLAAAAISLFAQYAVEFFTTSSEIDLRAIEDPSAEGVEAAPERMSPVEAVFLSFLLAVTQFLVLSGLAFAIGRFYGGKAERNEISAVVGWHALASVPANFAVTASLLTASPDGAPGSALVMIAATLYVLYMFASFIAEAHGFAKTGQVLAATVGVGVAVAFLFVFLATLAGVKVNA